MEVVNYRDVTKPLPMDGGGGEREDVALDGTAEGGSAKENAGGSGKRTLKLLLTDGCTSCAAVEYEPTPCLDLVRVGSKLILTDAFMARGIILLTPKCVTFVGSPSVA